MKKCWQFYFAVLALVLATLACGTYVTPTPTQTANTPIVTATVVPTLFSTPTEVLAVETVTPKSVGSLCVSANVAVHLRPSPSTENYPIMALPNGAKVTELGGRDGNWYFVSYEDKQGWVNGIYLSECE